MNDGAILELDRDRLVCAFHEESVKRCQFTGVSTVNRKHT